MYASCNFTVLLHILFFNIFNNLNFVELLVTLPYWINLLVNRSTSDTHRDQILQKKNQSMIC